MDIETLRAYVMALKEGIEEAFPFGPETLVFKYGGKIFLLMALDQVPPRVNVKCDPDKALELREAYSAIVPGYHMNKKHWNTLILDGSLPYKLVQELVADSLELIAAKLPKSRH
ncbi:MAG: MmcQ/YjbR family DNA-binding protein [Sphingobacteriales bacterium]|nr:MAG: MmcQ/YjbR family DNA-binding protein [Sphingobacteriales bacterium]